MLYPAGFLNVRRLLSGVRINVAHHQSGVSDHKKELGGPSAPVVWGVEVVPKEGCRQGLVSGKAHTGHHLPVSTLQQATRTYALKE